MHVYFLTPFVPTQHTRHFNMVFRVFLFTLMEKSVTLKQCFILQATKYLDHSGVQIARASYKWAVFPGKQTLSVSLKQASIQVECPICGATKYRQLRSAVTVDITQICSTIKGSKSVHGQRTLRDR